MAKIILFEGPDNNFKSSLINEIVNTHNIQNYVIIHSGKPETHGLTKEQIVLNQLDYNYNLIRNAERISDKFDMIFLDRSYIGEYVYGQMYRDIAYKEKHLTVSAKQLFSRTAVLCLHKFMCKKSQANFVKKDEKAVFTLLSYFCVLKF